jgi:hypothetical protein
LKADEIIAEKYLHTIIRNSIVYEPDGNVAPDFLIDGNIAVEVRRLTQNYFGEAKVESTEVVQIPFLDLIRNTLNEFDIVDTNKTYWVTAYIDRPIDKMKKVRIELIKNLNSFLDSGLKMPYEIETKIGFGIKINQSSDFNGKIFRLASFRDKQRQGWLHSELIKNIKYCIKDKTEKISRVVGKYPCWWLVLVNHIASGVPKSIYELVDKQLEIKEPWERLIIIDHESIKEFEKKNLTHASTL